MLLRFLFLFAILHCTGTVTNAQFFYKLDDEFTFNKLNLAHYDNDTPTKGCTLVEHSEFGDIYKPVKDELKTKGFTLKKIRYYTDLHDLPYVWLITAIATEGVISEAIIRGDMGYGAKKETRGTYKDYTWNGYQQQLRTYDLFLKKPGNDTCYVLIATTISTSTLPEFPSSQLLDWIIK